MSATRLVNPALEITPITPESRTDLFRVGDKVLSDGRVIRFDSLTTDIDVVDLLNQTGFTLLFKEIEFNFTAVIDQILEVKQGFVIQTCYGDTFFLDHDFKLIDFIQEDVRLFLDSALTVGSQWVCMAKDYSLRFYDLEKNGLECIKCKILLDDRVSFDEAEHSCDLVRLDSGNIIAATIHGINSYIKATFHHWNANGDCRVFKHSFHTLGDIKLFSLPNNRLAVSVMGESCLQIHILNMTQNKWEIFDDFNFSREDIWFNSIYHVQRLAEHLLLFFGKKTGDDLGSFVIFDTQNLSVHSQKTEIFNGLRAWTVLPGGQVWMRFSERPVQICDVSIIKPKEVFGALFELKNATDRGIFPKGVAQIMTDYVGQAGREIDFSPVMLSEIKEAKKEVKMFPFERLFRDEEFKLSGHSNRLLKGEVSESKSKKSILKM